MKSFILIFTVGVMGITSLLNSNNLIDSTNTTNNDTKRLEIVFDGYEGDTFFFTDGDGKALELTEDDLAMYDLQPLKDNEVVGEKYIIYSNAIGVQE